MDFAIQVVALAIVMGVFLHGGLHITCDFPRIVNASPAKFDNSIAVDFHDHRKPNYGQILETPVGVTGILMVIIMFFAMLLATHWFRKNLVKLPWPFHRMTGFNAFWYSHHLFTIVYVLLIVHSMELILTHSWRQKTVRPFFKLHLYISSHSPLIYIYIYICINCINPVPFIKERCHFVMSDSLSQNSCIWSIFNL